LNTVRRVAKNTLSLASAEIITKLLAFVLIIFVARHLQDVGFGKYSFALAFTSFFAIVSDLGLSILTIREVARDNELAGKYLGNISLFKFILSLIAFVLLVILINLMHYPPDTTLAVYIAGAYVIVTSFNQFFRSIFRAFEKMEYETLVRVFERVVIFSLVMAVIHLGYGLIEIVSAFLVGSLFGFLFSVLIVITKFIKPRFEIDLSFLKNATKEALPFGLTAIFVVIYFKIDTVMLSMMEGDAVVGWYNAAYNIIEGLSALIAGSLSFAVFPLISRYAKSSRATLKKGYIMAFQLLFAAGLTISILVTIFADKIIILFYGPGYLNSIIALRILIWAFFLICISLISSTLLNSIDKQNIVAGGTGLGALVNVVLNLILIQYYSFKGAAIATVITEVLGFFIYFYFVSKFLKLSKLDVFSLFFFSKDTLRGLKGIFNKVEKQ